MIGVLPAPHGEAEFDRLTGHPGPQLDVLLPGAGELAGQEVKPAPVVSELLLGDKKVVQLSRLAEDDGGQHVHRGQEVSPDARVAQEELERGCWSSAPMIISSAPSGVSIQSRYSPYRSINTSTQRWMILKGKETRTC